MRGNKVRFLLSKSMLVICVFLSSSSSRIFFQILFFYRKTLFLSMTIFSKIKNLSHTKIFSTMIKNNVLWNVQFKNTASNTMWKYSPIVELSKVKENIQRQNSMKTSFREIFCTLQFSFVFYNFFFIFEVIKMNIKGRYALEIFLKKWTNVSITFLVKKIYSAQKRTKIFFSVLHIFIFIL